MVPNCVLWQHVTEAIKLKLTMTILTVKALVTTAADNIRKYFFVVFSEKIRLDILSESSARQRIHMKHQALFPEEDKSKKLKCRLLQFLLAALRVKYETTFLHFLIQGAPESTFSKSLLDASQWQLTFPYESGF